MNTRPDETVVLLETTTGFEAETIAAALRSRGIEARTADTATAAIMNNAIGYSKVLVLRAQEAEARQTLRTIRQDSVDIDWKTEVGEGGEGSPREGVKSRGERVLLTTSVVLVPAGLFVLTSGVNQHNQVIQILGGAILAMALVAASVVLLKPGGGSDETGSSEG